MRCYNIINLKNKEMGRTKKEDNLKRKNFFASAPKYVLDFLGWQFCKEKAEDLIMDEYNKKKPLNNTENQ